MSDRPNWRDLPPIPEKDQPHFYEDWTPSQTFLRTMDRCDHAALLHLRYGGGASSLELNRGSIMHETIDRLIRMLIAAHRERATGIDGPPAFEYEASPMEKAEHLADQLEDRIPPELGRAVLYEVMNDHPEMQVSAEERDALRYLIDHWCRGTRFDPKKIIGVEKTLTLETNGFRVLIRPDLIEDLGGGVCQIRDWKSAWPPDSESFRAQAFDAQGRPRWAGNYQLNMAAVVVAFGITDDGLPLGNYERFRLRLEFPRILRSDETIDCREVEVDRFQVQSFRDDLDLQLTRLREVCMGERKWQPTRGTHCAECPAAPACPLPRWLRPESQHASLETPEALERAGTRWAFLTKEASTIKRRVKKAAEVMGLDVVAIGTDEELAFETTEKVEIRDREAMMADAEEASRVGRTFRREDHIKRGESIEFKKRKRKP